MNISFKIISVGFGIACAMVGFLTFAIMDRVAETVTITFLDVGQGDAILLSHGSDQILIDTGENSRTLLSEIGSELLPWDRTIEMVLLTHPDKDHVGAFIDIFDRYEVKTALVSDSFSETENGRDIMKLLEEHNVRRLSPINGMVIHLAPEAILSIVYPDASFAFDTDDTNASSVVAKLRVGNETFLFTGDLPQNKEDAISSEDIRVLKIAHHGSKSSTSEVFLDRMKPEEAVISVGKNSYGHPSQEVLDRLFSRSIHVFRTDIDGRITYKCSIHTEDKCTIVRP